MTIYNTSRSKCSLSHRHPVVRIRSGRRQVPIKEFVAPAGISGSYNAHRLTHDAIGKIYVFWSNWCANPASALTLLFGHGVQVTAPLHTQPGCTNPARISTFDAGRTFTRS